MTAKKKEEVTEVASAKSEEKPKAKQVKEKKTNKALEHAISKSKDGKLDEGKVNLPEYHDMRDGKYVGKDMKKVFRGDTVLTHLDFTECDLTDADFSGMVLQACKFDKAVLTGTNFLDCDLRWASFKGADLSEAIMGVEGDEGNFTNVADLHEAEGLE